MLDFIYRYNQNASKTRDDLRQARHKIRERACYAASKSHALRRKIPTLTLQIKRLREKVHSRHIVYNKEVIVEMYEEYAMLALENDITKYPLLNGDPVKIREMFKHFGVKSIAV